MNLSACRRHARVRGSVPERGEEPGTAGFSPISGGARDEYIAFLKRRYKGHTLRYREYIKKESPTDGGTENPHPSEVL